MAPSSCSRAGMPSAARSSASPLEDAEEQRAETGVLGGEQQRLHGHRRVDRPVRRRPRVGRGAEPGCRLVRFGVAVEVRLRIGERQGDHRCVEQVRARRTPPRSSAGNVTSQNRAVSAPSSTTRCQPCALPALGRARGEVDERRRAARRESGRAGRPGSSAGGGRRRRSRSGAGAELDEILGHRPAVDDQRTAVLRRRLEQLRQCAGRPPPAWPTRSR